MGFIAQVGAWNKSGKPVLLISDGHGSHTTDIMLLKAREHNIYIFWLPPHCTHKLQPLDISILGPLQSKFSENVDSFATQNGYGVRKWDFIEEYIDVCEAITADLICLAFKHCGISPFNPNVFTAEDFAPAQAFSSHAASHFPLSYPANPLTDDWNANTEIDLGSNSNADSKSNYSFATATSQSKSDDSMDSDSDSESKCDINLWKKITSQCSQKELEMINKSLCAQLQKKDDEIADLQAQTEQAKAHTVILQCQCGPFMACIHKKKQSLTE